MSASSSDPSGYLGGMTVVKIQGTSRDDLNGQTGIAVEYKADRGRYLIHLISTQTTIALKTDNLVKASTIETYKAQFEQLRKDPRVQQEVTRYYNMAQSKLPPGVKPEYAAGGLGALVLIAMYFVGFSKVLMFLSMIILIGLIMAPDIMAGVSPTAMLQNFPSRCRETIENSFPMIKGRYFTNRVAAAVVIFMLAMCGRSLLSNPKAAAMAAAARQNAAAAMPSSIPSKQMLEEAYKLGFDDATDAKEFGASLPEITDKVKAPSRSLQIEDDEMTPLPDLNDFVEPPPKKSSGFGVSQIISLFYLYRTAMQLGSDPISGGGFSMERFMANVRTMEVWQMGILGFSLYNVVSLARAFI